MPEIKQRPTSCKPRFWNAGDSNPMAKTTKIYGLDKGNVVQIGEFYYKDDADYAAHASSNHEDLCEALVLLMSEFPCKEAMTNSQRDAFAHAGAILDRAKA